MINRQNFLDTREHMEYRRQVIQNDDGTIVVTRLALRHLLQWADNTPLWDCQKKVPSFPEYMLTSRNDGKTKPLTSKFIVKVIEHARAFYKWARIHKPEYRKVSEAWIDTLWIRKSRGMQSRLTQHNFWTLEDAIRVATFPIPDDDLRHKRDQAAIAFMFLSGMRISAFVTLPLACVDIEHYRIAQDPSYGVQTKNTKAAITFLLPIPELLEVVDQWDKQIRSAACSDMAAWCPALDTGGKIKADDLVKPGSNTNGRRMMITKGMMELCRLAGVEYKSPHKLRHGHGVYGVKTARTMAELKVVSQNLMHSSVGITDGIYGNLNLEDMSEVIKTLTPDKLKRKSSPFERAG
jgi:integrase